jgi:hypothetical protein
MHDQIRNWELKGEIGDTNLVETKERMIHHLESLMRDYGYVPSIDNDPHFTRTYRDNGIFDFALTVYGVYVGKEEAWNVSGVAGGKTIAKHTARTK